MFVSFVSVRHWGEPSVKLLCDVGKLAVDYVGPGPRSTKAKIWLVNLAKFMTLIDWEQNPGCSSNGRIAARLAES